MNPATQIIYKAKSVTGQWLKGSYLVSYSGHYIVNHTTDFDKIHPDCLVDVDTVCIGCVIDGKEYFAGDKALWPEYGTSGVIVFGVNGFKIELEEGHTIVAPLNNCAEHITIIGNIHD